MPSALLRSIESIVPRYAPGYGGKARNLASLARAGFPVPPAFALHGAASEAFFRAVLRPEERPSALLLEGRERISLSRLRDIRNKVQAAPITDEVSTALEEAFSSLMQSGALGVSVRSSSTREDDAHSSYAGLYATHLNVRTLRALLDAVRECWAALFTPQALTYLSRHGADPGVSMAVIVQSMVDADVSGAMFTLNPLTDDTSELVINAVYGLGPSLMDGTASPDTWRVDKASRGLRDQIVGDKKRRWVLNPNGGILEQDVPMRDQENLSLDTVTLGQLVDIGLRIERHFEQSRDIEWAMSQGNLFILQARPITGTRRALGIGSVLSRGQRKQNRADIVWSNVNVGEALPGIATPLTWSVLSSLSEKGFRVAFGALGCSVPKDAELVGNFRGRIYLNMTEFVAIASQIPWIRYEMLFELGGGRALHELCAPRDPLRSWKFAQNLPRIAVQWIRNAKRLGRPLEAFETHFTHERRRLETLDLRLLSPAALDRVLTDAELLLEDTGEVLLTCYGQLLALVVVLKAAMRWFAPDHSMVLQQGVFRYSTDLRSAAPGLALQKIAEIARHESEAFQALTTVPASEIRVTALPRGETRSAIESFLFEHGHRGIREAELSEPRWSEDPSSVFAILKAYLHSTRNPAHAEVPAGQEDMRVIEERVPQFARSSIRSLAAMAHEKIRLREHLRDRVVQALGIMRRVALEVSRRIQSAESHAGSNAAFFLTLGEVHELLRNQRVAVAQLVRQRHIQHQRDVALPDPPDTFVGFPPMEDYDVSTDELLTGLGACQGVVEGTARVIEIKEEVSEFQKGEVLVIRAADVGLSPLFLLARGVVMDRGGILSHAAVILREFGVPSVVNVKHGTRSIRTGDLVRVDGTHGKVEILRRGETLPSYREEDEMASV